MPPHPTSTSADRVSGKQAAAQRWVNTVHSAIHANHLNAADYQISCGWNITPQVEVVCENLALAHDLAAVLAGSGAVGENIEDGCYTRRHALVIINSPVLIIWYTPHSTAATPIQSRGGGRAGKPQPAATTPFHIVDGAA